MARRTQRAHFIFMARSHLEEALSHQIKNSIESLSKSLQIKEYLPRNVNPDIEVPKDLSFGDLSTNIAMRLSSCFNLDALSLAEKIKDVLESSIRKGELSKIVKKIVIAKPGYINLWFSNGYLYEHLRFIKKCNKNYGSNKDGASKKIQLEFVSANPTGPLTVAHGRQAAIGDALANILKFSGYNVHKEYFVNDEGRQIDALGESILYHYLSFYDVNIGFPDDGYKGAYIKDIALTIKKRFKDRFVKNYRIKKKFFSICGVKYILENIKKDLKFFDVTFNSWFFQSSLSRSKVQGVLNILRRRNHIYQKDGATWFRSEPLGDEKDRVVIKSDSSFTYLAPDIAYHENKFKKGYDRLIDIWGPDHHGYVPRLKAAIKALGYREDSIAVRLVQLATLYRGGKAISMSTRKGEFITLREVIEEVGKDVTKFFFLMRKLDSHLDFDLEIAKRHSLDNPVYYIQYAHARIWSIKDFKKKKIPKTRTAKVNLELLKETEELDMIRLLWQFPRYVKASAQNLEPYFIIMYLNNLAEAFHDFYTKHRVVTLDPALSEARLFLIDCVRISLANGLRLLGVSLPKRM